MPFTIGESVGQYTILEKAGEGGMATVFKAHEKTLDRFVAIKALNVSLIGKPNLQARFKQEAQVIAKLEHPNIIPIYHFDEKDGHPYLVLKYVAGKTLRDFLKKGMLSKPEILDLVSAVGGAVQHAHNNDVLHRDIKPSNILIDDDGRIYLMDFGLAKLVSDEPRITTDDKPLGTPYYISPEQAAGIKKLTVGTDIYSFGVVLYELCVGKVPFDADTLTLIQNHIFDPLPRPTSIKPDLPESIEKVLIKALAKKPVDRFVSIDEMVENFMRAWSPDGKAESSTALQDTVSHQPYLTSEEGQPIYKIIPGSLVIGRNSLSSNIQVDIDLTDLDKNKRASRRHAVIQFKDGIAQVSDLKSRNGTYLNGERINRSHKLRSGDTLEFGKKGVILTFHSS